ncbi:MAG TPA: aminoglycoside phosphotransferase family protein [Fimbriimonas sp.]|nr:aminoglycoside phosphotransferase family protein [Fimbriimonas sp.]
MEQDWERAVTHREVSLDELQARVGADHIRSYRVIGSGLANTNVKVEFESRPPVLVRFYQRDPKACDVEIAVLNLVKEQVPVPAVIDASPDEGWMVLEWIDAALLQDVVSEATNAACDIGKTLAAIGSFRFDKAGFFEKDLSIGFAFDEICEGLVDYMRELLGKALVQSRMGAELVDKAVSFIDDRRALLAPYETGKSLVHADYKASNLLVRGGKVAAVLDWEFSHAGTPLLDLSILFRHRDKWPPGFEEKFVKGYVDGGGFLDPNWREATRYLDLVSLLDFLSREKMGPRSVADVLRIVRETVDS